MRTLEATSAQRPPRVLGLDLSLRSTGVALPDGTTLRIRTRAQDGDARLQEVRAWLTEVVLGTRPDLAVIEDLPTHAKGAGITGHVHGVTKVVLLDADVPYALVPPATLKSFATGSGAANKRRMAEAARRRTGVSFPGDLTPRGTGGDMCDAWWLRAAGRQQLGWPVVALPAPQLARLTAVTWPSRL
ncbi:hypothetical protein [Streptomyces sp. NPDC088925]|uniref:hypothetical protein n=1 Tax=Streptomyces sp. NPDC088925 TaxID=3365914 RepID=UPI0038280829